MFSFRKVTNMLVTCNIDDKNVHFTFYFGIRSTGENVKQKIFMYSH